MRAAVLGPLQGPLFVVLGAVAATLSVPRYHLWIVLVYTALAALLLTSLALGVPRDGRSPLVTRGAAAISLLAVAAGTLYAHAYTYLEAGDAETVRYLLAGTAVLGAVLLLAVRRPLVPPRVPGAVLDRVPDIVFGLAVLAFVIASVLLIHLDPAPRIDVWITLQQGADATWRGENVYAQNWSGSPGVQDAFTYLPGMVALLSPGRILAGDVRWALVVVTVVAAVCVRLLAGRAPSAQARTAAATAATMLLLLPGTPTQIEQAWTEPLLLACLAGWALAVQRGRTGIAIVVLALGVASKQHLVLLLPVLAVWPAFGFRRAVASGGLAGLFVLPWFLASPSDMWHDTVTFLVNFPPLKFEDTLYIAAIRELGWEPPFALTGALILATVAGACVAVARRSPDVGTVLRWCALVLLVANLLNKQAFYNQYWLVMGLVLVSWGVGAAGQARGRTSQDDAPEEQVAEESVSGPDPVRTAGSPA